MFDTRRLRKLAPSVRPFSGRLSVMGCFASCYDCLHWAAWIISG